MIDKEDENPNLVNFLKRSLKDNCFSSIIDRIFETNRKFHVKQHTTGKVKFPSKIHILAERPGARLQFLKVLRFSLKS